MGILENRDCQWASRSVLKGFNEDALTISADSLFQNGTARTVKVNWRRRVQHSCWWNLQAWPRSLLRVGCAKVDAMWNSRRPWLILNMGISSPRIRQSEGEQPFHKLQSELLHLFQCPSSFPKLVVRWSDAGTLEDSEIVGYLCREEGKGVAAFTWKVGTG